MSNLRLFNGGCVRQFFSVKRVEQTFVLSLRCLVIRLTCRDLARDLQGVVPHAVLSENTHLLYARRFAYRCGRWVSPERRLQFRRIATGEHE